LLVDQSLLALAAVLLGSFAAALALVPLASAAGRRLGFVDRPRTGEVQRVPMARSGGYAIVLAFLIGVALSLLLINRYPDEFPRLWGLLLGGLLLLPLALLDDWRRLSPAPQFVWQVAVACVPVWFGVTFDSLAGPFGGVLSLPGLLVVPLTLLWVVGMINTINLTDTMDGLAGGVAAIAALVLAAVSLINGQVSIAALALALAGACLGFLVFNFHPARIIMGSSGSLFLCYVLAVIAIIGGAKIATAMMVLGLPILDVAWVIVYRLMRGRSPFAGGDDAHLSHRLLALGWSQRRVALVLYGVCLTFGALSLVLTKMDKLFGFALLVLVALVLMVFAA
jgi:UDP-GlcNAc:undecaprenyl-phosphate/decaprenyl-phosphate GlcNAc-1-phosphate transferase